MRRQICLLLAFLFLIPVLFGCGNENTVRGTVTDAGLSLSGMKNPPGLTVSSLHGEVQALNPCFTWNGVSADGLFVFDLYLGGNLRLLSVAPNDKVELHFEAVPDRMKVTAWKAECATADRSRIEESFEIPVINNTLSLPIDSEYLYKLSAEWGEAGSREKYAVYVFGTSDRIE